MPRYATRGFTLIELLVVISIIGLLSSVILASLSGARLKAKDSAIKAEVAQLRTLMEFNYSDYGSYSNLSPNSGWIDSGYSDCSALPVSGTYATQYRRICSSLLSNESDYPAPAGSKMLFYTGVKPTISGANVSLYSMIAWLPGAQMWLCVGSNQTSISNTPGGWPDPGCWANP